MIILLLNKEPYLGDVKSFHTITGYENDFTAPMKYFTLSTISN
jgi:hypothetical protein